MKPEGPSQKDYFDIHLRGFCVRVSPKGVKSFCIVYRMGRRIRRMTLGTYPPMTLADARELAEENLRQAKRGHDPQAAKIYERKQEISVFSELAEKYIEEYAKARKKSWREDKRILKNRLVPSLGKAEVAKISRAEVRELLRGLAKDAPVEANRVLACLRKVFNWALQEEVVSGLETNPCIGIPRPGGKEKPKDRILTDDEIKVVWSALDKEAIAIKDGIKLILLTGQRPTEVAGMKWSETNLEEGLWVIPAQRSKNGLSNAVPLSSTAIWILEGLKARQEAAGICSEFVFPAMKQSRKDNAGYLCYAEVVKRIRKDLGINFSAHDLRRTCATLLGSLGVQTHIISRILNHKPKDITTLVYNVYEYLTEKREALNKLEARIKVLTSGLELVKLKNGEVPG